MAIVHRADLRPTKLELLAGWLPSRPWYRDAPVGDLQRVSAFRFDDPAGEVGVETLLVRATGGPLVQVPLTYRAAPLAGADAWFVGNTEHSVLGPRWVYDGCGDPVYAATLARAILTGGTEAEEYVDVDGTLVPREPGMSVRGGGSASAAPGVDTVDRVDDHDPALILAGPVELTVARILDGSVRLPAEGDRLTGTLSGESAQLILASARIRVTPS